MGEKLKVLDLFSGIGGFSLGLERTGGFETVAFCEIDPFCQKVLKKHWPDIPIYDDVRTLDYDGAVDVITGGFPCQDVSLAGKRGGLEAERSGLWKEYAHLIGRFRPSYVIVENTPGLLSLGMGTVLGNLATLGYDAEWHCIPACYVGAEHIRDRVWIVAYTNEKHDIFKRRPAWASIKVGENVANVDCMRQLQSQGFFKDIRRRISDGVEKAFPRGYRSNRPVLGRGIHGIPNRVDRIGALGNAVVPQIPELIGHAILEAEAA